MFIQCSECLFNYLVNSADLKPNGRIVECANCSNQWFQEHKFVEENSILTIEKTSKEINYDNKNLNQTKKEKTIKQVKNLPSTYVNEPKASMINTFLVLCLLTLLMFCFWYVRTNGLNIFVLINYYIQEFIFNIKLIINDIARIIHQINN